MANSAADEFRVWVGCMGCYNEGNLVGEWFAGSDAPQDMAAFDEALDILPADHKSDGHEELWVYDHEGSPVRSEYSPMDAELYAAELESIEAEELPYYLAWLDNEGTPLLEGNLEGFRESRTGYSDLAEYVADVYDGSGEVPEWIQPHIHAVYEAMARDMIMGGEAYLLNGEWFRSY